MVWLKNSYLIKKKNKTILTFIILATWEAEIGRVVRQGVQKTSSERIAGCGAPVIPQWQET
jgi:hypothetical protein